VAGVDASTDCFRSTPVYPCEEVYWGEPVPSLPGPADVALDLLTASVVADATIVAIGPYTNLAALEAREPGILIRARLVLMGTTIVAPREGFPTWGPETDYNVQLDVRSAQVVLACSDPLLVPLGPCLETVVCRSDVSALNSGSALAQLIAGQVSAFDEQWRNAEHWGKTSAGLPAGAGRRDTHPGQ
jgi:inosine-uridine nucleoside N-ribohydrolase